MARFDLFLASPDGDFLDISNARGERVTRIIKGGLQGFSPYDVDYINRLRKKLGLIAENGYDSARFYGDRGLRDVASEMIDLRAEVMRKLAKT